MAAAAIAVGSLAAAAPGAGAAAKKAKATVPAPFCSNPGTNYLAPVQKLQAIPALPEGGVLRYAPEGTTLAATGPRGLLIGGSNVGFRLTNSAPEGTPTKVLKWVVLERLIRLTGGGQKLHPSGLKRIDLKQLPASKHRGLTFPLPTTPAVYSVEVTIQNHRGRLLGRYGEYVRVVERKVEAGLSLPTYDNVPPGSTLEACFENKGTATMTPGATTLERLDGTTWKPVDTPTTYSLATRTLGPGESEKLGIAIPPRALGGLYKLTVTGTTDLGEPVTLAAEFGVV
ncbi:MAG TPA: hypothetical protein VGC32_10225 [Solirubrobacterales bacterium]